MPVRFLSFLLILALAGSNLRALDDGPAISITSPDVGATFAYGTIKSHLLFWRKSSQMLIVRVTFTDAQQNFGQPNEDTHEFRLPGITYDSTTGNFCATSSKGDVIPVAHVKKTLFISSIETLPNATVRILRERGNVSVILEAIRPDDPAMHPKPVDPDGTTKVDVNKMMN
jgi:hypothetical protein